MLRFLNFRVYNLFFYLWSYEWKIYENNLHVYLYTLKENMFLHGHVNLSGLKIHPMIIPQ